MTSARDPKQLFFMITSRVHSVRRRMYMCKHLGGIWKHLETSGGIWRHLEASGGIWRHLEVSGRHWWNLEEYGGASRERRGIWEETGGIWRGIDEDGSGLGE